MRVWQFVLLVILAVFRVFLYFWQRIKWAKQTHQYPTWTTIVPRSPVNKQAVHCILRELSRHKGCAGSARAVCRYTWFHDSEIKRNWYNDRASFCARQFKDMNVIVLPNSQSIGKEDPFPLTRNAFLGCQENCTGVYRVYSALDFKTLGCITRVFLFIWNKQIIRSTCLEVSIQKMMSYTC